MRARLFFPILALSFAYCAPLRAQVVSYTFGPSGTPTINASIVAANVTASGFASNLGGGTTSATSPGSSTAGGGGGSYFTASNWRSADSNYLYFTITPANGYQIALSGFSFYYASTSSGPNAASLTSSADNYVASLGTFSLTPAPGTMVASDWHSASTSITMTAISAATTFRLNASGASSAGGTLRVDAMTLNGSVTAVPEPATNAVWGGALALLAAIVVRRHKKSSAG